MDKTEEMIKAELNEQLPGNMLDMKALLDNTHRQIRRRAVRRKMFYSSPVAFLLVMMIWSVWSGDRNDRVLPGGELFMAGLEESWTSEPLTEQDADLEQDFFEQSVDYLIDDQYDIYGDAVQDLMDATDLSELAGFLKEV